jgi:hypothetical protein
VARNQNVALEPDPELARLLERWVRAHRTPQQVVKRCRIVLMAQQGRSDSAIAAALDVNRHTCRLWRERFAQGGGNALWEVAEGRGRKPRVNAARRSTEPVAAQAQALQGDQRKNDLRPRDPPSRPRLMDVVGVYLSPPQSSIVACVDEARQAPAGAPDWFRPGPALRRARRAAWTHDDVRNGTATLFTALKMASEKVGIPRVPHHRHRVFLRFLRQIDAEFAADLVLNAVICSDDAHGSKAVDRWLSRHPRFKVRSMPASPGWLGQAEHWFGQLTGKSVLGGSFAAIPALVDAIESFVSQPCPESGPFLWRSSVENIPEKIGVCSRRLDQIQTGSMASGRSSEAD